MNLKRLPLILGFLVLLLALPAAVFMSLSEQETRVVAGLNKNSLVYLWPQDFESLLNQKVTLEVKVDTKNQDSRRAEVMLKFDPAAITVDAQKIFAPVGVELRQKALNPQSGVLQLSGVGDFKQGKTLATLSISGGKKGSTVIEVSEAHVWDASGEVDILGETQDATINIQ